MILPLVLLVSVTGCAVTEKTYVSVRNYTKGEYYLQNQKYRDCITTFRSEIRENAQDPKAFYYLGRCYLAEEKSRDGLAMVKKAVEMDPSDADYHFWLGVAHAANGNAKAERKSYEKALDIDPDHVQALVYLGHNRFEAKDYARALDYYNRGLAEVPDEPQALFNRGLIFRKYDRTPEEIQAWRIYLDNYPLGTHARQATEYLNSHGVFDFRNHLIGIRTITLKKIKFEPLTAKIDKASYDDLEYLGKIFEKQTAFELHILGYQKNNKALAKERVKNIKRYLTSHNRRIASNRIKISWFSAQEKIRIGKRSFIEGESINFFTLKEKK